jgi:hypothetical protein
MERSALFSSELPSNPAGPPDTVPEREHGQGPTGQGEHETPGNTVHGHRHIPFSQFRIHGSNEYRMRDG